MQLTAGNRVLQSNWEGVSESLLSGILVRGRFEAPREAL